jgi:purine-nucleoside phosphorylase
MSYYDRLQEAAAAIRARVPDVPEVAVVLGSGLGDFANSLGDAVTMAYRDLPHWPTSAVIGHSGKLVVGRTGGRTIAALAGRCHLYEGHDVSRVAFAVRTLGLLGVKTLILTNAAGGVNTGFAQGALMVIDDHINLTGHNPLVGENDERLGVRFPDMTEVYSSRLRAIADGAAKTIGQILPHGIYAALLGPSYETPAEIRYLRIIGADAVGMSTVAEAIAARHMRIEVLGISCITNMAAGVLPLPLDHAEVMETAARVRGQFVALLETIIGHL